MSKTLDNQLFDIAEVLSGNSGYPIPSRPCFNEMTIDYQLYNLWRAWGGGIDPDAQAFIDVSGATDIQGINDFVKGIKALGLWNSMVCWPLRSSQNAGTGSTAYSLGGLGTYNGTLVNGPTWGASGINFNAAAARIAVTGTFAQPLTIMGSVNFNTTTNGGALIDGNNRVHIWNGTEVAQVSLFAGTTLPSAANTYSVGSNFVAGYANGASSVVYVNGAGTSGNAGSNTLGNTQVFIGNNSSASFGDRNIDIAFCAILNGQAYNDAVRALYKSTLGQGLGLP